MMIQRHVFLTGLVILLMLFAILALVLTVHTPGMLHITAFVPHKIDFDPPIGV